MTQNNTIAVVGAGLVGLASALQLQQAGFKVTLIDRQQPGMGASFGNAGLFADYAHLPFTRFAMLCKMPKMLLDDSSPLSIQRRYLPQMLPYGLSFVKACLPGHFDAGCAALTSLHQLTRQADDALLKQTGATELVKANGCLALFSSEEGFAKAQADDLHKRQLQGVNMQLLNANEVQALEPALAAFHSGGVYYPDTRFSVSPAALSRAWLEHFLSQGGTLIQDEVQRLLPAVDAQLPNLLQLSDQQLAADQIVVTAGVASRTLLAEMGVSLPMVSERGYHLTLDIAEKQLSRPVGWLDKAIYLTPMADGVRVAGTAEFADVDAPANTRCTDNMLAQASEMLGMVPKVTSDWVGSRPSTPDSLPLIGCLQRRPSVIVATGHGHLGLTLAALTGQLVRELAQGQRTALDLQPFAPERFS